MPAQLPDLAHLDQSGAEVRLQLLAGEVQRDRGHELGPLARYGRHDKAEALRHQYAEEHLNQMLTRYSENQWQLP